VKDVPTPQYLASAAGISLTAVGFAAGLGGKDGGSTAGFRRGGSGGPGGLVDDASTSTMNE